MTPISTTYAATITLLIITLLNLFGIDVVESEITNVVEAVIALFVALWVLKERYYKGGVNLWGVRK